MDKIERVKAFKKVFGYYDKGVYSMMTNKFKKRIISLKQDIYVLMLIRTYVKVYVCMRICVCM